MRAMLVADCFFALAMGFGWAPLHSGALEKAVERFGIGDEDLPAQLIVRRPGAQRVEQYGVIGPCRMHGRMRPVAAPDEALRRCLDEGASDRADIGVARWPDLRFEIGRAHV